MRREIDDRIAAHRLLPLHRGVYAVGHGCVSRKGLYLAAVLFAGEDASLTFCAGADLWEMRPSNEDQIDVTVPTDRRGDATVRIHRDKLDPSGPHPIRARRRVLRFLPDTSSRCPSST